MMIRGICGVVAVIGSLCLAGAADAQVIYGYGAPVAVYSPVVAYRQPVVVASPVVTAAYAYPTVPVYAPQPIVQTYYAPPAVVPAPVVVAPGAVRSITRGGPYNYTTTTRTYGAYGPHYSRVHVHNGPYQTIVRERNW